MPLERQQGWSIAGLAAAAIFAVGSIAAVSIANDQRAAQARDAGGLSGVLDGRYRAALAAIAAADSARAQAECELEARIVDAVQIEVRAATALEAAAVVENAALILPRAARIEFESVRVEAIESLSPGFTTDADAELAARYVDVTDVVAACLAERATPETPAPSPLTEGAVAEAEARAEAAVGEPELDTARLDALDQTVTALAGRLLEVADARVAVTGLEETDAAVASAALAILTATTSSTTLDALEALTAHAQAAVDVPVRQVQPAPQPDPEPAPAPRPRPVNPAPPAPEPEPTAEPEPQPTLPVEPGNGDGAPGEPTEP
ncbi:hypothetical protein [Agrococcus sp. TF02-05]|uniref:hypothetical protein n=1 Tax=Agrococcus sp. TF02-05 TaxID=2815211 RepID=UPI001AA0B6AA|nr:hypothetical protein [Agrococcus sp. TF02-05]MBO1769499.1 hypothetical protein [Agrococcus sp. TF02-05]